jgi:hypothetical protein
MLSVDSHSLRIAGGLTKLQPLKNPDEPGKNYNTENVTASRNLTDRKDIQISSIKEQYK